MGIIQTILGALRPSENRQSAIPSKNIGFSAIPTYRKDLLFVSKDKPPFTGVGISIRVSVTSDGNLRNDGIAEPSTIYEMLPVSRITSSASSVPKMGYFPSYTKMKPEQRAVYLNWLRDVTTPIEIGYVFVYFYGLERHLVYGNFDAAVNEILLLRKHHDNGSFQNYSASALVHACLLRKRVDTLQHLYLDLNFDYFGNSVLLILHQQNLDLLPDMLIRLAMSLGGVNKRYLKEKCSTYQQTLLEELREKFGKESYPFAANYPLDKVKGKPFPIFANISFASEVRAPPLPNFLDHKPFQKEFEEFFQQVHEKTKVLRKSGKRLNHPIKALPDETSKSE